MERAAAGQLSMKIDLVITVQYVPYPLWFEPNIRFTFADISDIGGFSPVFSVRHLTLLKH